jgi:adenylate cyclase
VSSESVQRRLAAILSADVVGYSRLMAEDEDATVRTLGQYREHIESLIRDHQGRLVDFTGDNFLAEFPSALDSVHCALEIQRELRVLNVDRPPQRRMEFRIGVHLGDVRVESERIYGDGVNIAARLEGLADSGGICISATVHEQVRSKLDVGTEDLGSQSFKNIAEPVRVYRVRLDSVDGAAASAPRTGRRRLRRAAMAGVALILLLGLGIGLGWRMALGVALDLSGLGSLPVNPALPEVPSIVVLPFANMSADPEQEYFSDGISEDLTTALSKVRGLFVISRNSAFTYKGQNVKIEDVGRELGVRYVLEGSVRKAGTQVRITAQLIDANSGFHIWSERYDRELADIFAVQSEISEEILMALKVKIEEAELDRIRSKPSGDLTAYDLVMRANAQITRYTKQGVLAARLLLEQARELDPDFPGVHALLGSTYATEYGFGWSFDPALLDRAEELARRELELNPSEPTGHVTLAAAYMFQGRSVDAIAASEKAIELSPNSPIPYYYLAGALAQEMSFVRVPQLLNRALRLDPRAPSPVRTLMAVANIAADRYEEAIEILERVRVATPELLMGRLWLASTYSFVERYPDAQAEGRDILRVNPAMTADRAIPIMFGGRAGVEVVGEERVAQIRENLRKAGLL